MKLGLWRQILAWVVGLAAVAVAAAAEGEPRHGIAMIGEPALPPGFDHLPYANPDAPKGGSITYGVIGTFETLNPFNVKGTESAARGLADATYGNLVFESLLMRSADEPFTLYGFLAETVEVPPDRGWVEFTLNPKARFSDGEPVTVDDVIFSLETLREKGRPNFRDYYSKVERIEKVGERGIRLHFENAHDRELPLILGLMPILPKHATDAENFEKTTLVPMIGSGPYILSEVKAPSSTTFKRNPDYWAKDLRIKRGFHNYDRIRIDYYRDVNSLFEAFKKGLFDVYPDGDPSHWETAYDFPALTSGQVVKEQFHSANPKGMSGLVFNTRRPMFADIRVRRALATLLDFDWLNGNLYYGHYARCGSYFGDSELSALGRPADERERNLLAPFPNAVSADVIDGTYRPVSAGSRAVLQAALQQLIEAGYRLDGNRLVDGSGKQLAFEIMVKSKEDERIALAYQRTLGRVGIEMSIRSVESARYQSRLLVFDYDMIRFTWPVSLSPGNEQRNRWRAALADVDGSFNYPGAREPAIDAMIAAMLAAPTREDFVAAVRALDRVLISGAYVVPLFYLPNQWIARWTRIAHPDKAALTGYQLPTWWAAP
jgi:peptide/nickel transport system substrate-binding protein